MNVKESKAEAKQNNITWISFENKRTNNWNKKIWKYSRNSAEKNLKLFLKWGHTVRLLALWVKFSHLFLGCQFNIPDYIRVVWKVGNEMNILIKCGILVKILWVSGNGCVSSLKSKGFFSITLTNSKLFTLRVQMYELDRGPQKQIEEWRHLVVTFLNWDIETSSILLIKIVFGLGGPWNTSPGKFPSKI